MYRVKYANNYVTTNGQNIVSEAEAMRLGYKINLKTKREAETLAKSRSKIGTKNVNDYKVEKVNEMKTEKISTDDLVDKLMTAVTAEYKNDTPGPGLVLAKLRTGEVYASVARYGQPGYNTGDKKTIASSRKSTLRAAIIDLGQAWLGKDIAKDALASALKGAW